MTSRKVDVRYATGWPGAVLHYEAAGAQGSCGGWKDEQMQPSSVEGWQEVSVQLPTEANRIELVFKNTNSNDWDNPPQSNRFGVGTEIYTFPGVSSVAHSHYGTLLTPEEQQLHTEDLAHRDESWPSWCPERLFARFDEKWLEKMRDQFSRRQAEEFVAREIEGEVYINGNAFHDPLRVSVSIPAALLAEYLGNPNSRFCEILKKDYKVCVSGGGDWRYLDLLPKEGGKLGATLYVMQQLGFTPERTLVCGDSGNDIDMFCHPSILGCCVGNSHEVLVAFLKKEKSKLHAEKERKLQAPVNGTKHKVQQPPEDAFSDATAEQKDPEDAEPFFLKDLTPTPHVCFSQYPCAGGILDALRFFKFDERVNGL
ncbi:hypothetical protein ACSSS7_003162 [Eimeria intestinalis]